MFNNDTKTVRVAQIIGKWVGGGVESVIMNYYRHIDRTQIQFDFICDNDSTNIPYEEIESLGGKVILISPYQKIFKYHKELKKVLKDGKYKIVHSHINTLSIFSLFAAKCAGVPIRIAHSHSTTNKLELKKNLLKQILRPFSKLFATNYMSCSEFAGRWLFGNKSFEKGEVYVLNNAVELNNFAFSKDFRDKYRKKFGINEDTLVIGHVGRFVEQKNHSFLVDVFNEVHMKNGNSVLFLIGQGPLETKIKEKVNDLGLENSVKFLGQRNDVNEIYNAMDIFVLPSLYEGLGMVLIEAQKNGLKCITSTNTPREVKIFDRIEFIGLEEGIKYWASRMNINNSYNRNIDISDERYNIEKNHKKLSDYYRKAMMDNEK